MPAGTYTAPPGGAALMAARIAAASLVILSPLAPNHFTL